MPIITPSDWNPAEATFRFPTKPSATNRKFIFINKSSTENKTEIQLADPKKKENYLWMPFNISDPMSSTGGGESNNERLTAEVAVTDPVLAAKLKKMDEVILKFIHENASHAKVFNKALSEETIADRYTPPFRTTEEEGKSNLLRLKISTNRIEVYRLIEYDEKEDKLRVKRMSKESGIALLTRGCRIAPEVEIGTIWFAAGDKQFGYSVQISKVIVDDSSSTGGSSGSKPMFLMEGNTQLEIVSSSDDDEREAPDKKPSDEPRDACIDFSSGEDVGLEPKVKAAAYL